MWNVLIFASGEAAGSEIVEVFDGGTGRWDLVIPSAKFEIGSTVAYPRVRIDERKSGRADVKRRALEVRRAAIVRRGN